MKLFLPVILTLIFSTRLFSQVVRFEKGYFINNKDEKITCMIENLDVYSNPKSIRVRLQEDNSIKSLEISDIKEFGVDGTIKYIRSDVKIDRPKNVNLGHNLERNPEWSQETMFLKVILEGKASLYSYADKNIEAFFFQLDNGDIQQFVFRKYLSVNNVVETNKDFRQQLYNQLNCGNANDKIIKDMVFKEVNLVKFIKDYNQCIGATTKEYYDSRKKLKIVNKITPGINLSQASMWSPFFTPNTIDFGSNTNFRIGFESEFFLPHRSNKLSFLLEPNYQYLSVEKELSTQQTAKLVYSTIELPAGFRYHMFMKDKKSKAFINAGMFVDIRLGSKIELPNNSTLRVDSWYNGFFGAGFSYKNKASLEVRYNHYDDLVRNHPRWDGKFKSFSLIAAIPLNYRK